MHLIYDQLNTLMKSFSVLSTCIIDSCHQTLVQLIVEAQGRQITPTAQMR